MTPTGTRPAPSDPTGGAAGEPARTARSAGRRSRLRLGASIGVLVVVLLAIALMARSNRVDQPLDPTNPSPSGGRALAQVLTAHGVRIDVARSVKELEAVTIDGRTTVLVAPSDLLSASSAARLGTLSRDALRVVLVLPPPVALQALDPGIRVKTLNADAVAANCTRAWARPGESLSRVSTGYSSADSTGCFAVEEYAGVLDVPAGPLRPPLVVVGTASVVANRFIADDDAGAVALRLLGEGDHLVWFIPSAFDRAPGDPTPADLVPPWIGPGLRLAAVALIAVFLWRGRRLGRIVQEPLPVIVKAVETTQARGRLYRRARDTQRAGTILRGATARKLTAYLALPATASVADLAQALAPSTGRAETALLELLDGPPPASDKELAALAAELRILEREVFTR